MLQRISRSYKIRTLTISISFNPWMIMLFIVHLMPKVGSKETPENYFIIFILYIVPFYRVSGKILFKNISYIAEIFKFENCLTGVSRDPK